MSLDGDSSNILNNPEISGTLRVDQIAPNFETFVNIFGNYNGEKFLLTDTIAEITSNTGTTVEGVLMKDFTITTNNADVDEDHLYLSTGDSRRWAIQLANTESGSNTGSDLLVYGFADNGSSIPNSAAIELERSTGDLKCANVIRTNGIGAYTGSLVDSGSRLRTTNSTNSNSTSSGALIASNGGLGVSQDATIGGLCNADYFRFGSSKSSAVASTIGNMYLDDGSNCSSGEIGLRLYNGSAWKDLYPVKSGTISTAVLSDGSNNFNMTSNTTFYYRNANLVFASIALSWDSKGSASGTIILKDFLPYDVENTVPSVFCPVSFGAIAGVTLASGEVLVGDVRDNLPNIYFSKNLLTSGTNSNLDNTDFSAAGNMKISAVYFTDEGF